MAALALRRHQRSIVSAVGSSIMVSESVSPVAQLCTSPPFPRMSGTSPGKSSRATSALPPSRPEASVTKFPAAYTARIVSRVCAETFRSEPVSVRS